MKYFAIAKLVFFYLLIGCIVLFSPLGPVSSYLIMIGLSALVILASGIQVRLGNPIAGLITGTLAMIAVFLIILAIGGASINGLRTADAAGILLGGVLLQVLVSTGEELSFRHFIFADLDRWTGRKTAAVVSSLAFAAMHLPSMLLLQATPAESAIALLSIFTASIVLTVLFLKWGILAAIGFHFTWNFLQYHVFGLSSMDAILEIVKTGSPLLNGGVFGPEASIPGLIVISATLVGLWYFYLRTKNNGTSVPEGKD